MSATEREAPAQSATADREITISRVINAPRELVFEAFTEVRHLSQWWGPDGFTTTTRAFEFRLDGEWDFVMHGPDGTDYQEWICWTEIAPPERIELLHGESVGDPNAFESVLTLAADGAATWLRTSPRALGWELRADGRNGVLQRVDVAGRFHRARVSRGPDGAAVDGT